MVPNSFKDATFIHRTLEANSIQMHVVEAGRGPLVLMLHGFPEGWYAWRHQMLALAAAGYHAVAPDQRGYGWTDRPAAVDQYSIFHLVGDVIGLVKALNETRAVVVGHDWGANVAWASALFRPDLVSGVAALSVPHRRRQPTAPLGVYRESAGSGFYQLYYQPPGVAEREFEANVGRTVRRFLCGESGNATRVPDLVAGDSGLLDTFEELDQLPAWLTADDLDHWTAEFSRTGYGSALNWYRNVDRNWELMAPWSDASITVPALYVVGDRDVVYRVPGVKDFVASLKTYVPNLTHTKVLPGCGHWTQQERPREVNEALLRFLDEVRHSDISAAGL